MNNPTLRFFFPIIMIVIFFIGSLITYEVTKNAVLTAFISFLAFAFICFLFIFEKISQIKNKNNLINDDNLLNSKDND
ncbi:hypothetical protein HOK00_09300 [bacterium]|jgi:hypothetical protein|nr:hypothetical protein [bacterium]